MSSKTLSSAMRKTAVLVLATVMFPLLAAAQSITVTGNVSSPDGPEAGVTVIPLSNPMGGTTTDASGNYSVKVSSRNEELTFTLMGFKDQTVKVGMRTSINIVLEPDATILQDVIVVGYGQQKKEFIAGAVSQVSSKDILKAPATNVTSLLAGRLSGLTTVQATGVPGDDAASILVRGYSTFNSSSPLFIVDGVERDIKYLNPNDIATISVLKDAATAAIYGVRGANGVIVVTTKTGAQGSSKISYNGSVSFDTNTAVPEFCNAEQYIYYHNKARELDGQAQFWTPENIQKLKDLGIYGDTDYLGEIYKSFGLTHQHNVSVSGGKDKVRYYASIGYMNQDGILKNTSFNRFNVRGNIDAEIFKGLKFNLNLAGNTSDRLKPGYNINAVSEFSPISAAYYAIPILTPTTPDGTPVAFKDGPYYRYPSASLTDSGFQNQTRYVFESSATLSFSFDEHVDALKGLKLMFFAAYNYNHTMDHNFMSPFPVRYFEPKDILSDGDLQLTDAVSMGITERNFNKSSSYGKDLTIRPQIDYSRVFGKNSISFTGLFERRTVYSETMTSYGSGYYADSPLDISLAMKQTTPPSGSFAHSGLASFAGRLDYMWDEKYIVGATLRADASSNFSPLNRWGVFPSIALGWVISKENFFAPAKDVVDFLKLRASYGSLGSDDTSPYLYLQQYSALNNALVLGGSAQSAFQTLNYVHDNLTWSHTNSYNVGFETRMFRNKFTMEFDWFYKLTDRILEYDSMGTYAPSLGGNFPSWMNSGSLDNRGFELNLRHDNWFSNGWTYSITGMLSWARNRVLSRRLTDNYPSYRQQLGQPIGSFYGFKTMGLYQTQEQIDAAPTAPSGYKELGAIMYQDVNGDGIINSAHDYVKIGRSQTPEMTFSLGAEVGWQNLHLSLLFQGAALCNYCLSGAYNNTTDNTMFTRAFYGNGNSVLYLVENAWTPEHTDAKYPRLTARTNANNAWASDMWIVDGSYLRLKNVQLSYTLPQKMTRKAFISDCTFYIAGTNLFTLCQFKYLDPENPGINNGYYPQQRTFSLGLNLSF